MPINRQAYTINPFSRPASGGVVYKANPANYGNATTKVINLTNNTWLSDSVVFTVDSAWRYVVHVRNTNYGSSSIHIDDVRVYGKNTASYLICGSGGEGYRFGFGGQEKDNEITGVEGSHNTAEYWMYDTRLGRRWNVDPVDQVSISNYACLGNNPIMFVDVKGDKFRVENSKSAKNDIKSLVKANNRKYIDFDADGNVSLNFKNKSETKINKILENDEGLRLVDNLVNAKEKELETGRELSFYYGTSGATNVIPEFSEENVANYYSVVGEGLRLYIGDQSGSPIPLYDARTAVINASKTPYGKGGPGLMPNDGYDGKTFVADGFYYQNCESDACTNINGAKIPIRVSKSEIILHELQENYFRTAKELPYEEAHEKAGGIKENIIYTKTKLNTETLW